MTRSSPRYEQTKAECDLLVLPNVKPGDWVNRSQPVARLIEIDEPSNVKALKAPFDGVVWNTAPSFAVRKGETMMGFRAGERIAE